MSSSLLARIERLYRWRWNSDPIYFERELRSSKPLRHPFGSPGSPSISQKEAEKRLRDLPRLLLLGNASTDSASDHDDRRGYVIACMLTGLGWQEIDYAMTHCREYGVQEAADMWRHHMITKRDRARGYLYVAGNDGETIKIGFSQDVEKRVKQLRSSLLYFEPATLLHEWTVHRLLQKYRVASETYSRADIPDFLFPNLELARS